MAVIYQLEIEPEDLCKAQRADEVLTQIIKTLEEGKPLAQGVPPGLRKAFIQNGLLCRNYQSSSTSTTNIQLVIPTSMKTTILQQLHDNSGHLGVKKTTEGVKQRFYTGQDMNLTSRNGYRNANSVSNAIFHNRNLKPHWEQSRLLTCLKKYLGTLWDHYLPPPKERSRFLLSLTSSASGLRCLRFNQLTQRP